MIFKKILSTPKRRLSLGRCLCQVQTVGRKGCCVSQGAHAGLLLGSGLVGVSSCSAHLPGPHPVIFCGEDGLPGPGSGHRWRKERGQVTWMRRGGSDVGEPPQLAFGCDALIRALASWVIGQAPFPSACLT